MEHRSKKWDDVREWYEYITRGEASDSYMAGYFDSYEQLHAEYQPEIERGEELSRVASTPLAALFYFVEMGFYPPPELLLGLSDQWNAYLSGRGQVSLEEAFLGSPKPKAGNYARQKVALLQKMRMSFEMTKLLRQGMTKAKAAEAISEWAGKDPETILRTVQPFRRAKDSEK